jgi:hypothetical protein
VRRLLLVCVVVACRAPANPPLAPAGGGHDDGVGALARLSAKLQLEGADDDGGGDDYVDRDRYQRTDDYDPLAYAGLGYGGFGYGGFGYGGVGYGGYGYGGVGLGAVGGYWSAPPPPSTYETLGIGDLGAVVGDVRWANSGGVAWPPGCDQARVATRGAGVVDAVAYLEVIDQGRIGFGQTAPVVTAIGCGLAPGVQIVGPVPSVAIVESRVASGLTINATGPGAAAGNASKIDTLDLEPGGRIEFPVDRTGVFRLAAADRAPAWLIAAPHPYYMLTDDRGRFALDGIPAGRYTLVVWHPPLVTTVSGASPTWSPPVVVRQEVVVRANATTTVAIGLTP